MLVTIVLLVKDGEAFLGEALGSIYSQEADFDFQIIAIDSGSRDRSREILRQYPATLVEIPSQEFNHGETRNLGVRLAGSETEFVVYLSQDAVPQKKWLACLIQPLLDDEQVAGVFSRHVPRPGASPALVRQLTTRWQTGAQQRFVKQMPAGAEEYRRNRLYYTYFSNTSSAIRKSVWDRIPFRRLDFAEDADWADRVLQAGHKLVFEPASVVIHSHDYGFMEQFRQSVDYAYAIKRLFRPPVYEGTMNWIRVFAGVPREVWWDWQLVWYHSPIASETIWSKMKWMGHSPLWQVTSALGTWVGAHLDRVPAALRLWLSRQERLRQRL